MVWRYSQRDMHDMVQRLVKEIGKTNPLIMRLILAQGYNYDVLSSTVRDYFLGMNDYAFENLQSMIEGEIMDNDEDSYNFTIDKMKARIIWLMREYGKMNGLEGMGICPISQVNYLAEKTSSYFEERYKHL